MAVNNEESRVAEVDHRQPVASFLDKWRQRWPEWGIAQVFVPAHQRELAQAWFALLQEWSDAAWAGADPAPGLAKLAWWQEELRGWNKGARRHPLGQLLQPQAAPWDRLADALSALRKRELASEPIASASAELAGFAAAVAAVEQVLFGGDAAQAPSVIGPLLAEQAARDSARRHALLADWPGDASGSRPRRILAALARQRLQHVGEAPQGPLQLSRWGVLWRSWQAARN